MSTEYQIKRPSRYVVIRTIVVLGLMVFVALLAPKFVPRALLAEESGRMELAAVIPDKFGDWVAISDGPSGAIVSPQVKEMLETLYDGTLERVYRNSKGDIVMLSVAYGASQSKDLQLHRPEVCYSAQGFKIKSVATSKLPLKDNSGLQIKRLVTQNGTRIEPVTYWMRVGDYVLSSGFEQALARFRYALEGYIADGLLVRVSSINTNTDEAFRSQDEFLTEMLSSVSAGSRQKLIGSRGREH